jgi:hypothetical protein
VTWARQEIADAGLAVEVDAGWPVETVPIPGGAVVRWKLPGGAGEVFVRYGDEETVDRFVAIQRDAVTTVTVGADEAVTIGGRPARRLTIEAERPPMRVYDYPAEGGFVDERRPARRRRLVVLGFDRAGTPVVAGYDATTDALPELQPALDRFLKSVTVL